MVVVIVVASKRERKTTHTHTHTHTLRSTRQPTSARAGRLEGWRAPEPRQGDGSEWMHGWARKPRARNPETRGLVSVAVHGRLRIHLVWRFWHGTSDGTKIDARGCGCGCGYADARRMGTRDNSNQQGAFGSLYVVTRLCFSTRSTCVSLCFCSYSNRIDPPVIRIAHRHLSAVAPPHGRSRGR